MGAIARRIAATPARTASETWTVIIGIVAPLADSEARAELERVRGFAASLIAAEAPGDAPIVVAGVGDQVRIYCLFGEDAVLGETASEAPLAWDPTDGDWSMSLPCFPDDLDWVRGALASRSQRVTARDATEAAAVIQGVSPGSTRSSDVNMEAFLRP